MSRRSKYGAKRDGALFIALPHVVIDSAAYRKLGHVARSLLIDIARQYTSHNNGKLTACMKYLRPLGWTSVDTVTRAKGELLASGLLIETRKGGFPNRSAWYMLAWHDLDIAVGLDSEPATYQRARRDYQQASGAGIKGVRLAPPRGAGSTEIAPAGGIRH